MHACLENRSAISAAQRQSIVRKCYVTNTLLFSDEANKCLNQGHRGEDCCVEFSRDVGSVNHNHLGHKMKARGAKRRLTFGQATSSCILTLALGLQSAEWRPRKRQSATPQGSEPVFLPMSTNYLAMCMRHHTVISPMGSN